ncbi:MULTISPECIES: hypothetical protein [unclassified Streptomyces]|uniref:hypothetical protein n=1 Tax=unclassified Streptomyces TaxID=2593676 RepID=UPI0035E07115
MTVPVPLATAEEIRTHLVDQLNQALRRAGMFGGEVALRLLIDHLLFVERRPEAFARQQQEWEERGLWSCIGVRGAFRDAMLGHSDEYGMASVYGEFAQRCGWLSPDRVLAPRAYEDLVGRVRRWAGKDRTWADVTTEFGEPSVLFGGTNPRYGKTLGYLSEDPEQPMVFFHLWNDFEREAEQPLLLAVRFSGQPLPHALTFTPQGELRRSATGEPCSSAPPSRP